MGRPIVRRSGTLAAWFVSVLILVTGCLGGIAWMPTSACSIDRISETATDDGAHFLPGVRLGPHSLQPNAREHQNEKAYLCSTESRHFDELRSHTEDCWIFKAADIWIVRKDGGLTGAVYVGVLHEKSLVDDLGEGGRQNRCFDVDHNLVARRDQAVARNSVASERDLKGRVVGKGVLK